MKNNNKDIIIGIGSFLLGAAASAAIAAFLWDKKESQRLLKELNRLADLKNEIDTFGEPSVEKVNNFKSGSLDGITKTLERNDFCNDIDGYGYMARKCAIMIIRKIAECMEDGETLSNFANRTKYGKPVAPVIEKDQKIFGISCGKCPNCNSSIYSTTNQYCHSCGKAIVWNKQ